MTRFFLVLALLFTVHATYGQDTAKNWRFGAYSFRSYDTSITILRDNDVLYHSSGGDPVGYIFVDTLSLNKDELPDFAFAYVDEYYSIDLLVSQPRGGYKNIHVTDFFEFEPSVYHTTLPEGATVVPLRLRDINRDGKRDMLIGILDRETGYAIPRYTQTIRYDELRNIAAGKKPKKR